MRVQRYSSPWLLSLVCLQSLFSAVSAKDILKLSGFQECNSDAEIKLHSVDVEYDADIRKIVFSVDGESTKSQKVTASLKVEAYGKDVYSKDFNPCDQSTFVAGLCPVPVGRFNASSEQIIPAEFASQIPAIAFSVPDIAIQATLELKRLEDGQNVGCVVADLSNGKSVDSVAVTYVAAGIVGGALLISAASSIVSALHGGGGSEPGEGINNSPSFSTIIGYFQSIATTGMVSVQYPPLYQSFTERFAFSTGLISWDAMQNSIDTFRSKTGGNSTISNISNLKNTNSSSILARAAEQTPINPEITKALGIDKYVQEAGIVKENAFMTIFLITMIIILVIIVFLLLFKAILEAWAVFGNFPMSMMGFRKHYWGSIFRTVVMLINLIFPIWVLYSIYQFREGDSWGATLLAGVTLVLFAGTLAFFIVRIFIVARQQIKLTGSASRLFEDKEVWLKFSIFYDNLKKETWWFFAAYICYMFLRNALISGLSGKGIAQTASVLATDIIMLIIMCFLRPFAHRTENVVHIIIQIVRVATWGCILVFVDELKVERSTQTIMGFALVIVTSILTVLLVGLMLFNGIYQCVKDNPHRKRRKEAEKARREEEFFLKTNPHDDTSYRSPDILEEGRRNSYYSAVPTVPEYEQRPVHLRHMSGGAGGRPLDRGPYDPRDPARVPLSPGRPF